MTDQQIETHTVHFSIDGEWLTNFIRRGWSEGRYEWAMKTLEYSGCPQQYHNDVIRGKLKMVGVNEMELESDDWKPDLSICHMNSYPDPNEIFDLATEGEKYKKLYFERLRAEYSAVKAKWDGMLYGGRDDLCPYIRQFPQEFIETLPEKDQNMWQLAHREVGRKDVIDTMNLDIPSVDEFIERERMLEQKEQPREDLQCVSDYGWILPNGKFYPCQYWEHDWLVGTFDLTVGQAENQGWIRVGYSQVLNKPYVTRGNNKPISQRQIDTVNSWCLEHEFEIPSWVKENDDWYEWVGEK